MRKTLKWFARTEPARLAKEGQSPWLTGFEVEADLETQIKRNIQRYVALGRSEEEAEAHIRELASADVSGHVGSYINWIISMDIKGLIGENMGSLRDTISRYDAIRNKLNIGISKDILSYKTPEALNDAVSKAEEEHARRRQEKVRRGDEKGPGEKKKLRKERTEFLENVKDDGGKIQTLYDGSEGTILFSKDPKSMADTCHKLAPNVEICLDENRAKSEPNGMMFFVVDGKLEAILGVDSINPSSLTDGQNKAIIPRMNEDDDYSEKMIPLFEKVLDKLPPPLVLKVLPGDDPRARDAKAKLTEAINLKIENDGPRAGLDYAEYYGIDIDAQSLIDKLIEEGNYDDALDYAKEYGVEIDPKPFIDKLIEGGDYRNALYYAKEYGVDAKPIIDKLIEKRDYHSALDYAKEYGVEIDPKPFIDKLIEGGDYRNALYYAKYYGVDIDAKPLIDKLIEKGDYSDALYHAEKYGVDPKPLIDKMIEKGDYMQVLEYAKKYGIEIDPKPLIDKMIEGGDYRNALHYAKQYGVDLKPLIDKIVEKSGYDVALPFAQKYNIKIENPRAPQEEDQEEGQAPAPVEASLWLSPGPVRISTPQQSPWLTGFEVEASLESAVREGTRTLMKALSISEEEAKAMATEIGTKADPTGEKGKYTIWLISQKAKGNLPEDLEKALDMLTDFIAAHKYRLIHDISLGSTDYRELSDRVGSVKKQLGDIRAKEMTRNRIKNVQENLPENADVVYQDKSYKIIEITTPDASIDTCNLFGAGSAWCVGNSTHHAERYLEDGPLYLFLKDDSVYAMLSSDGELSDRNNDDDNVPVNLELKKVWEAAGLGGKFEIDNTTLKEFVDDNDYDSILKNAEVFGLSKDQIKYFIDKLIEKGYYNSAIVYAEQHGVDLKPLIDKLIEEGNYDDALDYAKEYGVEIDPKPLIDKLIEKRDYHSALYWAKEYGVEVDAKSLIDKLIEGGDYRNALYYAKYYGVDIDAEPLIDKLIEKGYYNSAIFYAEQHGVDLKPLIDKLIEEGNHDDALDYAKEYGVEIDPKPLIDKLIEEGSYRDALSYAKEYGVDAKPLIDKLIEKGVYSSALSYAEEYGVEIDPKPFIDKMIEGGDYRTALYYAKQHGVDLKPIIDKMIEKGYYDGALRRAKEYGIEIDAKPIIDKMLEKGDYRSALHYAKQYGVDLKPLIDKIVEKSGYDVAFPFAQKYNIKIEDPRAPQEEDQEEGQAPAPEEGQAPVEAPKKEVPAMSSPSPGATSAGPNFTLKTRSVFIRAFSSKQKVIAPNDMFLGTSGFNYDKWVPNFYPKDLPPHMRLAHYASIFPSVEVSSTSHKRPETRVLSRWRDSTPDGFVFSLRAPQEAMPLQMPSGMMDGFMRRAELLEDKLGPIVFTLQDGLQYAPGLMQEFLDKLPAHQYAIQVDSDDWANEEVMASMDKRNVAMVRSSLDDKPYPGNWSYSKFGCQGLIRQAGRGSKLSKIRDVIRESSRPSYAYMTDGDGENPTTDAASLMKMMKVKWIQPKIDGPWDPIRGPNSFGTVQQNPMGPENQVDDITTPDLNENRVKYPGYSNYPEGVEDEKPTYRDSPTGSGWTV
jgi:uncharacterized protein YecE (DUF72 family)/predicted nucleic acid-binding protein